MDRDSIAGVSHQNGNPTEFIGLQSSQGVALRAHSEKSTDNELRDAGDRNLIRNMDDKTKLILPGAVLLAALMISGSLIYLRLGMNASTGNTQAKIGQNGQTGAVKVSADDDPVLGNKKAKVEIIEFSDFQCPFCRAFWKDSFSQLKKDYIDTGKARLVYRDFPLSFHPQARPAALAGECANEQGKFWEMHDKIFSEQQKRGDGTIQFDPNFLKQWASEIGLNSDKFNTCYDSAKYNAEIDKDSAAGAAAGVEGTPTFFINGQKIVGAQPYSVFKTAIDSALK